MPVFFFESKPGVSSTLCNLYAAADVVRARLHSRPAQVGPVVLGVAAAFAALPAMLGDSRVALQLAAGKAISAGGMV